MPSFLDLLKLPFSANATPLDPAEQDRIATEAQAKLPAWRQKEIRGFNATIEALLGAIGVPGAPDTQAERFGEVLGAIMPLTSPLRNATTRAIRLKSLVEQAPTPALKAALKVRVARNPRLMSHYLGAEPIAAEQANQMAGGMKPVGQYWSGVPEPRGVLLLNRRLSGKSATQTIAHETQHLADYIRMADRARQRGVPELPPTLFGQMYTKAEQRAGGYFANPFEVRARAAAEASTLDRELPAWMEKAAELAQDPMQQARHIGRALKRPDAVQSVFEALAPSAENVDAPPLLSELLKRLDPRFRR